MTHPIFLISRHVVLSSWIVIKYIAPKDAYYWHEVSATPRSANIEPSSI